MKLPSALPSKIFLHLVILCPLLLFLWGGRSSVTVPFTLTAAPRSSRCVYSTIEPIQAPPRSSNFPAVAEGPVYSGNSRLVDVSAHQVWPNVEIRAYIYLNQSLVIPDIVSYALYYINHTKTVQDWTDSDLIQIPAPSYTFASNVSNRFFILGANLDYASFSSFGSISLYGYLDYVFSITEYVTPPSPVNFTFEDKFSPVVSNLTVSYGGFNDLLYFNVGTQDFGGQVNVNSFLIYTSIIFPSSSIGLSSSQIHEIDSWTWPSMQAIAPAYVDPLVNDTEGTWTIGIDKTGLYDNIPYRFYCYMEDNQTLPNAGVFSREIYVDGTFTTTGNVPQAPINITDLSYDVTDYGWVISASQLEIGIDVNSFQLYYDRSDRGHVDWNSGYLLPIVIDNLNITYTGYDVTYSFVLNPGSIYGEKDVQYRPFVYIKDMLGQSISIKSTPDTVRFYTSRSAWYNDPIKMIFLTFGFNLVLNAIRDNWFLTRIKDLVGKSNKDRIVTQDSASEKKKWTKVKKFFTFSWKILCLVGIALYIWLAPNLFII